LGKKELLKKERYELNKGEFLAVAFLDGHNVSEKFGALSEKGIVNKLLRFRKLKDWESFGNIIFKIYSDCQSLTMSNCFAKFIAKNLSEEDYENYCMAFLLGANNKRSAKEVNEIIDKFVK